MESGESRGFEERGERCANAAQNARAAVRSLRRFSRARRVLCYCARLRVRSAFALRLRCSFCDYSGKRLCIRSEHWKVVAKQIHGFEIVRFNAIILGVLTNAVAVTNSINTICSANNQSFTFDIHFVCRNTAVNTN